MTDDNCKLDPTKVTLIVTLIVSSLIVIYKSLVGDENAYQFFEIYMLVGGGLTFTKGAVTTAQKWRGAKENE